MERWVSRASCGVGFNLVASGELYKQLSQVFDVDIIRRVLKSELKMNNNDCVEVETTTRRIRNSRTLHEIRLKLPISISLIASALCIWYSFINILFKQPPSREIYGSALLINF